MMLDQMPFLPKFLGDELQVFAVGHPQTLPPALDHSSSLMDAREDVLFAAAAGGTMRAIRGGAF